MSELNQEMEQIKQENKVEDIRKDTEKKIRHKENGITVDDLIGNYLKRSSEKLRMEYLKAVIKPVKYVNYLTKCYLAEKIVNKTCLDGNGNVHIDSCRRYFLTTFMILDTWTNIEINSSNFADEYDRLDSVGLIEPIFELIPEKEREQFNLILKMKQDDLITNKYEIHGFITDQLTTAYPEMKKLLEPVIEKLTDKIETLDEKKVAKMLEKVVKFVK